MFTLKKDNTIINNLTGYDETFREQKTDQRCTLIPILTVINILSVKEPYVLFQDLKS